MARLRGVKLILVSLDSKEKTLSFVKELKISLPILIAPRESNSFSKDYKINGWPAYCLIDKQGKVVSPTSVDRALQEWQALVNEWMFHNPSSVRESIFDAGVKRH
jgi:hypothetical protein